MRSTVSNRSIFSAIQAPAIFVALSLGLLACAEKEAPPTSPEATTQPQPAPSPLLDDKKSPGPERGPKPPEDDSTSDSDSESPPPSPKKPPEKPKVPSKTSKPGALPKAPPAQSGVKQPSVPPTTVPATIPANTTPPSDSENAPPTLPPSTDVPPPAKDEVPAPEPADLTPPPPTDTSEPTPDEPPTVTPVSAPQKGPRILESVATIESEAATEETLRDLFSLPAVPLDTRLDVTVGSGDQSDKFTANNWRGKPNGFKETYYRLSDLEKERFFNLYIDDVKTLYDTYFTKEYLDNPKLEARKSQLTRTLRALFFRAQLRDLPTDGNGYSDDGSPFKTWGANFILPKILPKYVIKKLGLTPGRFLQEELSGKLTLDDLELGIQEYFNNRLVKTVLRESASELKNESLRKTKPELRLEKLTLFMNRAQSAPTLTFKNSLQQKAERVLNEAILNLEETKQTEPKWAEAVNTYRNLLNERRTGFVVFPLQDRFGKPLVLFKAKRHVVKAAPKPQPSRVALPGMTTPQSDVQVAPPSSWFYLFEHVFTDQIDAFIAKLRERSLEERTLYVWKSGNDTDKLLVALHFPEAPQPGHEDGHVLLGDKDRSRSGADTEAFENLQKGALPHPSVLLDLRPFVKQFNE